MPLGILARVYGWSALSLVLLTTSVRAQSQQSGSVDQQAQNQEKSKEAQTQRPSPGDNDSDSGSGSQHGLKGLTGDFLTDQKQIWTSPARLRLPDVQWLVPLGGAEAVLFATDSSFSRHLSSAPSTTSHYSTLSNAAAGGLAGVAGGMWLLGHIRHDAHWTETGFLAGEAAVSSFVVTEAMKYSLGRERPFQDNANGSFFQGGTSFPSEHAAAAWSIAGVIAHEYPGPFTKIVVYSLASLVDFSRIRSRQHFPSDVLAGTVIGNFVAQDIYSRRHDPELGGEAWRSVSAIFRDFSDSPPSVPASPFVPLDSWVYPAMEKLAAQGFIQSMFLGVRPWTRIQCVRLLQEAGDRLHSTEATSGAGQIYQQLYTEFYADLEAMQNGGENAAKLDSVYTQSTEVLGQPLNDSYHFGQTVINNFGRPYQRGFNTDAGFSAWAADGRFAIYVSGEYQHAPAAPGFSQNIENFFSTVDGTPLQTAATIPATDQFSLLDTYVSTAIGGWNFSFGKQSLWWGQARGGALIFSDNAAPIYMFRASRTLPFLLPGFLRHIGAISVDAFVGKLSGNEFPPRPVLHGEKISFKPTKNLEFAFLRTAEMGGAPIPGVNATPLPQDLCPFGLGRAITSSSVLHSYFSLSESNLYACNSNPGKRTSGFEFSYRLPFLRNWVTLYTDSLSPDDVSPISAPRRAAVNPGIYISHFPKLSKLDLRLEAANTNTPSSSANGQYVYFDNFYRNLSTNEGNIIGSWIGREGLGLQAWSTYSFSARTYLQFSYRHAQIAADFIPHGENVNDGSVQLSIWPLRDLNIVLGAQYEHWIAPLLSPATETNWTSTIGISYHPKLRLPFHSQENGSEQNSATAITAGGRP